MKEKKKTDKQNKLQSSPSGGVVGAGASGYKITPLYTARQRPVGEGSYDLFTVELAPARAGGPVADALCDRDWRVDEVRLHYAADQATVYVYAPHHPANADLLADDMRHVWAHLANPQTP